MSILNILYYSIGIFYLFSVEQSIGFSYPLNYLYITFILMLYCIYCFYKNNVYKKYYGNLIFILSFIIILTPWVYNKLTINKFIYDQYFSSRPFSEIIISTHFIGNIYPACLICLSTIVNYFTYKKYNEY
ncbi:hypothetical protein psyc5s11_18230 [Clostridium gelidum]|uniref:Uncharacterized protein n=1 Tax=Clostridium gelidum TaxID=704125 RepID=A0ABN6IU67_9CLOT|nr:hypothetical protein psyc5s11_18230 [Clostridium gelidum]